MANTSPPSPTNGPTPHPSHYFTSLVVRVLAVLACVGACLLNVSCRASGWVFWVFHSLSNVLAGKKHKPPPPVSACGRRAAAMGKRTWEPCQAHRRIWDCVQTRRPLLQHLCSQNHFRASRASEWNPNDWIKTRRFKPVYMGRDFSVWVLRFFFAKLQDIHGP